jgi:hypothetical protein
MVPLTTLAERLRSDVAVWYQLRLADLVFVQREYAVIVLILLVVIASAVLLWQFAAPRRGIVLPALIGPAARSREAVRHLPLVVALAGLPCFAAALADPIAAVAQEEVSYPGRRIALLIDASTSMMVPFAAKRLRDSSENDAAFLTTVAAADTFVRQRKAGRYRDFIAVIEFGDEAYVITPFTTDYDNALLSISLIGDWNEYMRFPDGGTAIGRAIDQATGLFRAFDFLNAAGNVMVIFSDGQDTQVTARDKTLAEVLAAAVAAHIPVYLIRTSSGKQLGDVVPDAVLKPGIEATGGRFYAAAKEEDVIRAIRDIDLRSEGTIAVKTYTTREPRFAPFAALAVLCWTLAIMMKVSSSVFTKFP